MSKRQIVLDTETTGLEPELGHRVIEIGCVELIDRRFTHNNFHYYLNPEREIDAGALEVHGITSEFLLDKPKFSQIKEQLIKYLSGAELIIHNAAFDVGFLDHEFRRAGEKELCIADLCEVIDSLQLARQKHPGQKNSLDALCKRHGIDNSQRTLHGALLDAEILADVYLALTGGQSLLNLEFDSRGAQSADPEENRSARVDPLRLRSVVVSAEDLLAHDQWLSLLGERSLFQ
jgi:DNA polymerase III subunit epsilon